MEWAIDIATAAGGFTGMSANSAADACQRIGVAANLYASSNRPSAMSETYRPALVWAGQAIMQGKLVLSQSLSTFLSLKRFSKRPHPGRS